MINKLCLLGLVALTVAGCGSSSNSSPATPQVGTNACSNDAQKQFVLDAMNDVYFWNTSLPASVNLADHASPEALLDYLTSFSPKSPPVTGEPVDRFSYITSAEADAQFFGEGKFEGFGFSWRYEAVDDIRFTRVFSGSPAAGAGFERGSRIVALDGRTIADIDANEGVSAMFDMSPLSFTIQPLTGDEFTVSVTKDIVTIDPLPQWRVIDYPGGSAGYMEFSTFISTADPVFDTIFAAFRQASITDLIVDLRYNGGGLVSTAELLGDYLGGTVSNGLVFSKTLFNANNSAFNTIRNFQRQTNSLNLSRLVIIATGSTASASELVTNSMEPHVEVTIVGDDTFGKPVGQVGIEFCEKILRPTAFETVNVLDQGGYFDGLPVDVGCEAADDISIPVGAINDPNIVTAIDYLEDGACPVVLRLQKAASSTAGVSGTALSETELSEANVPEIDWRGPAHREYGRAF